MSDTFVKPLFDSQSEVRYTIFMPRTERIVIPNVPYHVTQRGNHQIDVFYNPEDRAKYLEFLQLYTSRFELNILAYCLMTNHIHLVAIPRKPTSLSRTMQVTSVRHTKRINRTRGWSGNLWQQRYFSCALDNTHLYNAIKYVEQNPIRAGIVGRAEDYLWSSASCHCGLRDDTLIMQDSRYRDIFDNWSVDVNQMLELDKAEYISRCTYKGIPCGNSKFRKKFLTEN